MNLLEEFTVFLSDHQGGMSLFQDDYLVTARAGITAYGQYKQALRELMTRFASLEQTYTELAKMEVDIDELTYELSDPEMGEFNRRRKEIDQRSLRTRRILLEKRKSELEVEFARFWQQAAAIRETLDDLTPERRYQYEIEYWDGLLTEQYVLSGGRVDDKLLRNLASMPHELRADLIERFQLPWVDLKEYYLNRGQGDGYKDLPLPDGRMNTELIKKLLAGLIADGTGLLLW